MRRAINGGDVIVLLRVVRVTRHGDAEEAAAPVARAAQAGAGLERESSPQFPPPNAIEPQPPPFLHCSHITPMAQLPSASQQSRYKHIPFLFP